MWPIIFSASLGLLFPQNDLVGKQIVTTPTTPITINEKQTFQNTFRRWTVVEDLGKGWLRIAADNPPTVARIRKGSAFVVRKELGWWNKYAGNRYYVFESFYPLLLDYEGTGKALSTPKSGQVVIHQAIPLQGQGTVYLGTNGNAEAVSMECETKSSDRVLFILSFSEGFEYARSGSMGLYELLHTPPQRINGRLMSSVVVAGEWDAQRRFSEKSPSELLGYPLAKLKQKAKKSGWKGLTKIEFAILKGWPDMPLSPAEALRRDGWLYDNIPNPIWIGFRDGRVYAWDIPRNP